MERLALLPWLALTAAALPAAEPGFEPKQVVRPFDPIVSPASVAAAEAGDLVRDDELVLGVVIAGSARAYPINMLTNPTREIINDELGGRPIAATW